MRRLAGSVVLLLAVTQSGSAPVVHAQIPSRPNILIILTDDQRATDTLQVMPRTREWFSEGGTTYEQAFATTPFCCPSRASIMSGRFAHNHGVKTNQDRERLDQASTIQRALHDGGYRTAILGKFLNGWRLRDNPPNFDRWVLSRSQYCCSTEVNDNGTIRTVTDYMTDYLRDRAVELIETDVGGADEDPWFMLVAPLAPHEPWEPAARHADADVGDWSGNPAVAELDREDKPDVVRNGKNTLGDALPQRRGQLRTLLAVDELVEAVMQALSREGEENTLAFFLSDNGYFWAEHGLIDKNLPYSAAVRVPLLARWPGHLPGGAQDRRHVANIDLAPTILDATDIQPSWSLDGRSMLQPQARSKILLEGWVGEGSWASIRSVEYQYTEFYGADGAVAFLEYYDLVHDPWQLENVLADRVVGNEPHLAPLERELAEARTCGAPGSVACEATLDRPAVPTRCPDAPGAPGHHLVGSSFRDDIAGTRRPEVACGLGERDAIRGQGGKDLLRGGEGRDVLWGGAGRDALVGNAGYDVCRGGPGRDKFRGCERERG